MIDMEVRWSDGWKAGNVLQIYEKAVVIFAVGFFPFLQLIIWGIEELTDSTLRSIPHIFLMWFGILSSLLLIWELSKSFFAWGRKRGMRLLSVIKKIWYGFVVVIGIVVRILTTYYGVSIKCIT